jgi:hypothetical protein
MRLGVATLRGRGCALSPFSEPHDVIVVFVQWLFCNQP